MYDILSTHPINTPYQHILSTHSVETSCQHTLLRHRANTLYQNILLKNFSTAPYQPILSTHYHHHHHFCRCYCRCHYSFPLALSWFVYSRCRPAQQIPANFELINAGTVNNVEYVAFFSYTHIHTSYTTLSRCPPLVFIGRYYNHPFTLPPPYPTPHSLSCYSPYFLLPPPFFLYYSLVSISAIPPTASVPMPRVFQKTYAKYGPASY